MLEVLFLCYLGFTITMGLVQYFIAQFPAFDKRNRFEHTGGSPPDFHSFVSIHLPICNEPPNVVIKTIRSLLKTNYRHFEVIVLDNNTDDERLWRPVEKFCSDKSSVKFVHIPNLQGHKAGALNKCIEHMDERTKHILVVDADYVVEPEILNRCVNIAETREIDLLQLPQSYRNTTEGSILNLEYKSYFNIFMNMANWFHSVLSTGTLAFIRYEALRNVGGWKGDTLTEDADLGVRLLRNGYRTTYVSHIMGCGLTPLGFRSLDKQRRRWVTGNIQVLKKHLSVLVAPSVISFKQKVGVFFQLTAWVDFKIIALILFSLLHITGISPWITGVFWSYFFCMILLKLMTYKKAFSNISLKKALGILALNQSLAVSMGLSWLKGFLPLNLKFEVTNKGGAVDSAAEYSGTYLKSNITGLLLYSAMILFPLPEDVISSIVIAIAIVLQTWCWNYAHRYFKEQNSYDGSTQD